MPEARPRFQDLRLDKADVLGLLGRVDGDAQAGGDVLRIGERLSREPACAFRDLRSVCRSSCDGPPVSDSVILAMRDFCLNHVDKELQQLYRSHFASSPPPATATHEERVSALGAIGQRAFELVNGFDWAWLVRWLDLEQVGEDARACLVRLSNFGFRSERVNFRFTYHCNVSCRHCYNRSGPNAKTPRLEVNEMLRVIDEMPDAGIDRLNLTGGEPFLYLDQLLALIVAGRRVGLRTISIYSNGFWASSTSEAGRVLASLKMAGFMSTSGDHLKISAGVYHQEFIDFGRIITLTAEHYRVFQRPLQVDFELTSNRPEQADEIRRQFIGLGIEHAVSLSFRRIQPLGRGQDLEHRVLESTFGPCPAIDQIVFEPDGTARPCCGLNNENRGIEIGNLRRHGLRELVKRMQNDPILQRVHERPMDDLFDLVGVPRSGEGYAGKCHLCQHALGALTNRETLQKRLFAGQKFYPFWFSSPLGHPE